MAEVCPASRIAREATGYSQARQPLHLKLGA